MPHPSHIEFANFVLSQKIPQPESAATIAHRLTHIVPLRRSLNGTEEIVKLDCYSFLN